MNKKGQEQGILIVFGSIIIVTWIVLYFILAPGSIEEEYNVVDSNIVKMEMLSLARSEIEYEGSVYSFLDLVQIYYDTNDVKLYNLLNEEIEKMSEVSNCEKLRALGMDIPAKVEKVNLDEYSSMENKVVFDAYDINYNIVMYVRGDCDV
jgi:hypothetical protein